MIPPVSCLWVDFLVKLFKRHEHLGVIGARVASSSAGHRGLEDNRPRAGGCCVPTRTVTTSLTRRLTGVVSSTVVATSHPTGMRSGDMFFPSYLLNARLKPKDAPGGPNDPPWGGCQEGVKDYSNHHRCGRYTRLSVRCGRSGQKHGAAPLLFDRRVSAHTGLGLTSPFLFAQSRNRRDPVVDVPFDFVTVVDMAPLGIRAEAFRDVGAHNPEEPPTRHNAQSHGPRILPAMLCDTFCVPTLDTPVVFRA